MNNKINSISLCSIIFSLGLSTFYGIFSAYVLNKSKTDTIFSMIIGYIISIFLSFIIIKLFSKRTNENLSKKIKYTYGLLSIILNILIIICSIFIYIFITYRLTSFISTQYLIKTNKDFIYLLIILVTYKTASKGNETTTRLSTLSIYICMFIFILIVLGLITQINIDNYLPLFTSNKKDILYSSIIFSLYFTTPLFFINIVKKDDLIDKNNFNKYFFIIHFITFIITFISIMLTLGVYGVNVSNLFDYPIYTVLSEIKVSTFIDSIENVLVMFYLICAINASNISLLFIFNHTNNTFNKNSKLINIFITIILFLIPTIFYRNNNYFESFDYILFPTIIVFILMIIIFLTYIILSIKNKTKNLPS